MKKILLSLVLLMSASVAMAQLNFGFKAGVNGDFNNFKLSELNQLANIDAHDQLTIGMHAGIQVRLNTKIDGLYVQGEALYNYSSTKAKISTSSVANGELKLANHSLNIPLLVGYKYSMFRVYAGPTFTVGLSNIGSVGTVGLNLDYDTNLMGYQAGIGFDLLEYLTIDLNYNGGFGDSDQSFNYQFNKYSTTVKNQQIWLSVGIMF